MTIGNACIGARAVCENEMSGDWCIGWVGVVRRWGCMYCVCLSHVRIGITKDDASF